MKQDETLWEQGIAVIGMSGRFPGANDLEAFWNLLSRGVHAVRFFSDEELLQAGVPEETIRHPQYIKAKGVLDDPLMFDADFFGMNPRESEWTDPQQRIFLECAYEALENAAWVPDTYPGRIGVYGGCSLSSYMLNQILTYGRHYASEDITSLHFGNDKDFLTSRVSYKLNLKGPGVTVQTACSTSLVAVHMACQSLMSGECDIALAGGSTVTFPNHSGYQFQEGMINSPDGFCRAFDREAQGTVPSNGVGVVVLKRLEKAAADGDFIYAVIRGSAINNDGGLKAGFAAPSPEGQAEVIAEALAVADVHPDTVSYVEAHGTGTVVGDPIEIAGLTMAYRQWTDQSGFCAIGSVKTNLGHLDCAAGVAGLIKTVLALHHRQIPPSLHYREPNPQIDFSNSPFYVNTELTEWKSGSHPRRAGVSSFGIGATNAHVVLEETPETESEACIRPWHALFLSAKTETALEAACERMVKYLSTRPAIPLEEIAYTTQIGRKAYPFRRAVVCRDDAEAQLLLTRQSEVGRGCNPDEVPATAWIFLPWREERITGLLELCRTEPAFYHELQKTLEKAENVSGLRFKDRLPDLIADIPFQAQLNLTPCMRVVLSLAASYSLAAVFGQMGLVPDLVGGEEEGEYAAACIAGCCSLEEAFRLAIARADHEEGGTAEEYAKTVKSIPLADPRIPFLNKEQGCLSRESVLAARSRELLYAALEEAQKDQRMRVVGLGALLHEYCSKDQATLSCFDPYSWIETLSTLWVDGTDVDWQARYVLEKRRRIPLPTYPFERRRFEIVHSGDVAASYPAGPKVASNEELAGQADLGHSETEDPRRYVEQKLIQFYEEVLGVQQLDIHTPFYELGGDSVNKMQVISRIQEMYPIPLNMKAMYEAQTVAELTDIIELAYIELLEQDEEERGEGNHDESRFIGKT
ncbi:type I polyketide synthase [Paenibacillus tyrfis]|uniref:type I polyketide synthase n=1 Tax=Paenibacillus tyrfis TaxID=1501230 RepID=UPI000B5880EA|nr:type I polyketide synthase [Paenibacillus tyrfis]